MKRMARGKLGQTRWSHRANADNAPGCLAAGMTDLDGTFGAGAMNGPGQAFESGYETVVPQAQHVIPGPAGGMDGGHLHCDQSGASGGAMGVKIHDSLRRPAIGAGKVGYGGGGDNPVGQLQTANPYR